MRKRTLWFWIAGLLAGGALVVGCGSEGSADSTGEESSPAAAEKQSRVETLELVVNEDGASVKGRSILLTGTVTPGQAEVLVNGESVLTDTGGDFKKRVGLKEIGENVVTVRAKKGGFRDAKETVRVERRRTAREIAALRERRRRARERRLANLRANARAIPPKDFQKDPDRYTGDSIAMSGEIFQIQEGRGEANFFLMNTECSTEFDIRICNGPEVYVSYDFDTRFNEDSFVTVYGVVEGGYEYDTAIGGSNYVGHIRAEIIE